MPYNDPLNPGNKAGFEETMDKHDMTLQVYNGNLLTNN